MEKKLHELFKKCAIALEGIRSYAEGLKITSRGDDKEVAESLEYSAESDGDFISQFVSGGMPTKEEVKRLDEMRSYWNEYSEKWDTLEDDYLTKIIKNAVSTIDNAYRFVAWAVNPRRSASERIASELMRVARLLEAADDMAEFRRSVSQVVSDMDGFKAWFDKKAKDRGWLKQFLHSFGDTGAHETLFLDALDRARESVETIWDKLNESDETPFQIKFSKGMFRNLKEWLVDLSNILKGEKIGGVDAAQFIHHVENMEYWWRKVS